MARCAFLGLGVMGYHMAGHLLKAGHEVVVWNRTESRAAKWAEEFSGKYAQTISQAVENADFVMACVGDDPDVYSVTDAAFPHIKTGAIFVDHTTASADCARACSTKADAAGLSFVDAPISGGEAGAVNGQLSIMCGGPKHAWGAARPVMNAYAKAITYLGPSGAGQLTKMVNQICIAGLLQGLSEGVAFAQAAGLDMETVLQAIGKGAAQSWQMDNRALTMAKGEFEFGFAVDWMRKDLGIALSTAERLDLDLPVTRLVDAYYSDIQSKGGQRWDTSSLITRLDQT